MAAMISQGDVDYLRSLYPELDLKVPTGQQEQLLCLYFRGMSISKAAKEAGYRHTDSAREYLRSESGRAMLEFLKEREFDDVRIDRDSLTAMFMEAYNLAANSTEKIAAARELGKLHGVYPDQKKGVEVNITQNNIGEQSAKQLQRLSDAELAQMVGPSMLQLLHDEQDAIEGDYIETSADGAGAGVEEGGD